MVAIDGGHIVIARQEIGAVRTAMHWIPSPEPVIGRKRIVEESGRKALQVKCQRSMLLGLELRIEQNRALNEAT